MIRDGRHDLGKNGIWIQHSWLGHDEWFSENNRDSTKFRNDLAIKNLAKLMKQHRITYIFPHLCPCKSNGMIDQVNSAQVERFLDHFDDFQVIPWIGGVLHNHCSPDSAAWRDNFIKSTLSLLEKHPRLAGVQVNIEPLPSGNPYFLKLLEELKAALPAEKTLSVAAYPPPTRWNPFPEVHWDEDYFRQVASRCPNDV